MKFRILYDVRYANGYMEIEAESEEGALKIFDKIPDPVLRENTDATHVEIELIKEIE